MADVFLSVILRTATGTDRWQKLLSQLVTRSVGTAIMLVQVRVLDLTVLAKGGSSGE